MPLHDWSILEGWEGMHLLWTTELLRDIKSRLPDGFRAYLGAGPALAIGAPATRPDVSVRGRSSAAETSVSSASQGDQEPQPDVEIAVATLEPDPAVMIERDGRLVSAVELVSPRNKDRPVARSTYLSRYAGYLIEGVHLLLVDVHRRPAGFSFADAIARELQMPEATALAAPLAISYRVGERAATGGRFLSIWRRDLRTGEPLPNLPLGLTLESSVPVDLESTYTRAAQDAYLD